MISVSLFSDAIQSLRFPRDARPRTDGYSWTLPTVGRGSIDLVADLTASYATIYHTQPWVYASVNKIARLMGMLPLKTYQRGEGRDRERVFDGELPGLMRRPFRAGTPSYWKQHIVGSTLVWGNGIAVKLGATSSAQIPTELFPAPAVGWSLGENDTYVWTSERGERYPFPRWQIIHFRYWDVAENGFGVSALEPLRRTLAIEDAASRFGVAAFKNGARPASIVQTDQELSEDVLKRLRANIETIHGDVDKAFRTAVLEQGLDWKPLTHNLKDAVLVEHRKLTREEVAAVFDIPQPSIGILDEANFASITALNQMLYQSTLGPWMRMIEETIHADFLDYIPAFEGMFVEFDENMILRGTPNDRAEAYQRFYTSRVYTPNEMRAIENLPRITDDPTADQLYVAPGSAPTLPDPAVGEGENTS